MISIYVYLKVCSEMLADSVGSRLGDERGQTAAEYLGIIVVIVAIIAILATNDIGEAIRTAIMDQIKDLTD